MTGEHLDFITHRLLNFINLSGEVVWLGAMGVSGRLAFQFKSTVIIVSMLPFRLHLQGVWLAKTFLWWIDLRD